MEEAWVLAIEKTQLVMNPRSDIFEYLLIKNYSGDLESIVGVRGGETSSKAVSHSHTESHWKVKWVEDEASPRMSSSLLGSSALPLGHPN